MAFFKINNQDFSHLVSGLKIGTEVLVSDESGRNANGDTVIDIVNSKHKVYVTLRHTTQAEMQSFLAAVSGFVMNITFLNPQTNTNKTITAYIGTPEPEYFTIRNDVIMYKPFSLNFIEL